jgi:hypothetical protein
MSDRALLPGLRVPAGSLSVAPRPAELRELPPA